MCGKARCLLAFGGRRTLRGSRAHCAAMPKSLGKQGYDRGEMASHIAALYLALLIGVLLFVFVGIAVSPPYYFWAR
jgi:hypothetical protein